MKNHTKFLLASGSAFFALTLIAGPVFALSGEETFQAFENANATVTASDQAQAKPDDSQESAADQKQKSEQRIKDRKDKIKTKLADSEQRRLKLKCKASQGKLSSLKGRINGIETSHTKVYGNLVDNLTALSSKLKGQGVDTAQLDTQITELKKKITTFNTDLTTYKDAVSDLSSMDCVADPAGFKASLEVARTSLATLRQDGTNIKSYVKDTIRPTLQAIRKQLDPNATDDKPAETAPATQQPATGGAQ